MTRPPRSLKDGNLVAAAEEERFTRIKHDFGYPENAIRFCLEYAGISSRDLDYVVFYEKPFQKFERILMTSFQGYPRSWKVFREAMLTWLGDKLWVKTLIKSKLGVEDKKILFSEHHLSHAASAFFPSPFDEAAILTIDGVGEWTTASMGIGKGNEIKLLKEIKFPHSLGLLYSAFTAFLGFQVNEGEYKVMGMAPYGKPRYLDKIYDKLVKVAPDGSFWLNMDYFSYHYSDEKTFNSKFEGLFGEPRKPEMHFFTSTTRFPSYFGEKPSNFDELCRYNEYYADIAASIQIATEEIVLKLANSLQKETGPDQALHGGRGRPQFRRQRPHHPRDSLQRPVHPACRGRWRRGPGCGPSCVPRPYGESPGLRPGTCLLGSAVLRSGNKGLLGKQ